MMSRLSRLKQGRKIGTLHYKQILMSKTCMSYWTQRKSHNWSHKLVGVNISKANEFTFAS